MLTFKQYLHNSAVPKKDLDVFLDSSKRAWARFDPEVGYTLGNSMVHDGLDDCWTISTAHANGARTGRLYADRPCRINTYGNSFTQCHQVSDGETWQEYLAAHLGEPIRNFGMGGFGVYQAYRRMRRTELSELGAKNVLLFVWGDDHIRSLMRCRHALTYPFWDSLGGMTFHGNFWAHLEMDLASKKWVEHDSLLPTPESLYKMTDPDFMYETLKDDLMVILTLAGTGNVEPSSLDLSPLKVLAGILKVPGIDDGSSEELKKSAQRLRTAYGFAATKFILNQAASFCRERDKKLGILLFCPSGTRQLLRNEKRYDQEIVDFIGAQKLPYFDLNLAYQKDYQSFNLPVEEYMKRYFIGHHSPAGNHFMAYALKNTLVQWLDPKPATYREDGSRAAEFKGYLPDNEI